MIWSCMSRSDTHKQLWLLFSHTKQPLSFQLFSKGNHNALFKKGHTHTHTPIKISLPLLQFPTFPLDLPPQSVCRLCPPKGRPLISRMLFCHLLVQDYASGRVSLSRGHQPIKGRDTSAAQYLPSQHCFQKCIYISGLRANCHVLIKISSQSEAWRW